MKGPRTSFLIPVHDAEGTLLEALESALRQTSGPFEVVVVDDGSTDASAEVAASVDDCRVRLLRPGRVGLVAALNLGLEACRGDLIARLDADDRAMPHRLEGQVPRFDDPRTGLVDGQVRFFADRGEVGGGMRRYEAWINGIIEPGDFDRELLVECPVVHPAATFRRDLAVSLGGYRHGAFPEDYDLWLRMHAAGARLRKVPAVAVEQRQHEGRLTWTDPRYGREGFRRVRQSWLRATVLATPRRVVVWGAGRGGRPWVRWLGSEGHTVPAVVDIDPKKIGSTRSGSPVVAPEALADVDADLMLVAVAAWGARARIRAQVAEVRPQWIEGRDWWAVL